MATLTNALGFALGVILALVLPALRRKLWAQKGTSPFWKKRAKGTMYLEAQERPEPEPLNSALLVQVLSKRSKK